MDFGDNVGGGAVPAPAASVDPFAAMGAGVDGGVSGGVGHVGLEGLLAGGSGGASVPSVLPLPGGGMLMHGGPPGGSATPADPFAVSATLGPARAKQEPVTSAAAGKGGPSMRGGGAGGAAQPKSVDPFADLLG
eukprot:351066-Chlamydomonas_euryale.AAC.5